MSEIAEVATEVSTLWQITNPATDKTRDTTPIEGPGYASISLALEAYDQSRLGKLRQQIDRNALPTLLESVQTAMAGNQIIDAYLGLAGKVQDIDSELASLVLQLERLGLDQREVTADTKLSGEKTAEKLSALAKRRAAAEEKTRTLTEGRGLMSRQTSEAKQAAHKEILSIARAELNKMKARNDAERDQVLTQLASSHDDLLNRLFVSDQTRGRLNNLFSPYTDYGEREVLALLPTATTERPALEATPSQPSRPANMEGSIRAPVAALHHGN